MLDAAVNHGYTTGMSTLTLEQRFPRILRRLRQERGWTQQQLADRAGITKGAISHLEVGRCGATMHTIGVLAKALAVSPEIFFGKI